LAKGGRPDRVDVDAFLAAGYTERHILEIILAVAVKTLSNWSNHVFNTPVDAMFAAREWTAAPAKAAAA
jgi:alkylhydroperoxidase family enzyme